MYSHDYLNPHFLIQIQTQMQLSLPKASIVHWCLKLWLCEFRMSRSNGLSFDHLLLYGFISSSSFRWCAVYREHISYIYIYMYILSYYLNHMKWMYSYSDYDYLYSEVLEYKSWNTLTADRTLHFQCQNPRDSILLRLLKKWCKWCSI